VLVAGSLTLDRPAGGAFATLGRLGALLLQGTAADAVVGGSARAVTTGVAFVLVECMLLGAALAWLVPRLRRAPTAGLTFNVALAALLAASLALDRVTGADVLVHLRLWATLTLHALAAAAMTLTLRARRPRIPEGRREIRQDEP
jgi:hypothetical protein